MENISEISGVTGFDHGEYFESDQEVREYFTVANLNAIYDCKLTQEILDKYAETVIKQRWHYSPRIIAQDRVSNSARLAPHAEFIMDDWGEDSENYWQWVATASEDEILDWVL